MSIKESRRPAFEQAVIDRMKEGGFLEVEIRVECLARSSDGYYDGSVDAYWHFWNTALDGVVIELPKPDDSYCEECNDCWGRGVQGSRQAIEAAGLKVKP